MLPSSPSWAARRGALALPLFLLAGGASAQGAGSVLHESKIAWSSGGFAGALANGDLFGGAVASLGDLDGDGTPDVALGAPGANGGGADKGALWLLFLNSDGTVKGERLLDATTSAALSGLASGGRFGASATSLGDLDGDGLVEVAVGAENAPGGGLRRGEVWVLSLDSDGTVGRATRISSGSGGFSGAVRDADRFGRSLAAIGDLNGDGTTDLLVGADQDDDGGTNRGAAWVLFLSPDGTVVGETKLSSTSGGFGGGLSNDDRFGAGVALIGDLDGDGLAEFAVGADQDDAGASGAGAVWILFPNADGTVRAKTRIDATSGLSLGGFDRFGRGLSKLGDIDGDGLGDLAAGATGDDDGALNPGAVWVLFLDSSGGLAGHAKISLTSGGFSGAVDRNDRFGEALAAIGDVDGDHRVDVLVGANGDDEGGTDRGAGWVLFLDGAEQATTSLVVRNGSGANPTALASTADPRVGGTWAVTVDLGGRRAPFVSHTGYRTGSEGRFLGRLGELLVDIPSGRLFDARVPCKGETGLLTIMHEVPSDPGLAGLAFASQAFIAGRDATLTNALDGVIQP